MTFMHEVFHSSSLELESQHSTTKKSRFSKLKSLKLRKVKESLRTSALLTGTGMKTTMSSPKAWLVSDNTQPQRPASPLLQLPAELRNQIYEYVLGEKSTCLTSRDERPIGEIAPRRTPPTASYNSGDIERGVLQLLTVCRQIYHETHQLPFTLNVFRYSNNLHDLVIWKQTKPESLDLIRSARLYSNGYNNEETWIWGLKYFKNLKNLEVAVHSVRNPTTPLDLETEAFAALRNWESDLRSRAIAMTHDQLRVTFFYRYHSVRI